MFNYLLLLVLLSFFTFALVTVCKVEVGGRHPIECHWPRIQHTPKKSPPPKHKPRVAAVVMKCFIQEFIHSASDDL